ncbi:MAG: germination protein YpeB, partial [Clostridia bacterium]|nr:germination protein YpeB [Clostridia bacterium]
NQNKAFYELIENIEKIESSLKKSAICADSHSLLSLGADIRESSAFAISDLGEIESDTPLVNINTFLNQAGDYVKAVALAHADGSRPTEKELDTFLMLSGFSTILKTELYTLREKLASGEISYSSALSQADETLGQHLSEIESTHFSSYNSLTYDGAFSSHMESVDSPYLSPLPEITKEDAQKNAIAFLSNNVPLVFNGESSGSVPSYMFFCDAENSHYSMEVTKKGGKLLIYSESRAIGDAVVGTNEAVFHAITFAENSGFPSMEAVFYEHNGNILTVTLAPLYEEVIYYTDKITVEVALDTASVIGFNAEDYLMNHKERTFPESSSVAFDSLADMNKNFYLKSLKKTYIPTEYGSEVPCYEALGEFGKDTYLVYLNAESGLQEEILILSQSNDGYFAK